MSTEVQDLNERFIPDLKIDLIDYSKHNPRKFLDQDKLQELAKSIVQHGVVEPIVVRPHPKLKGRYELVAGERRHRASVLAKKDGIPSIIRSYNDQQAAEVQQIENLQRADIHPLDEAHGFQRLIQDFKYSVESIAEKIGKTPGYVLRRMTLAKLKKSLQEAMWKEKLSLVHAEYLCRLSEYDQTFLEKQLWQPYNDHALIPMRQLKDQAERSLFMSLDRVPWKQTDDFVRNVSTCQACPKRTGCAPLLFPEFDKKPNVCTDRECFDLKMTTYIDQKLIAAPKTLLVSSEWNAKEKGVLTVGAYKALYDKKDTCDSEQPAIFLDGDRAGHPVRVCINEKCEKHHSEIYRNASNHQQSADSAKQQREWRIEAASLAAMFKEAWDVPTNNAALKKGLSMEDLKLVAEYAWSRAYNRDKVAKAIGWTRVRAQGAGSGSFHAVADQFLRRANLPELVKFIMLMVCNDEISHNGYSPRSKDVKLSAVAKQWGADVLKARNKTRTELEAKYKAKAKNKKKAAK